jgi:chromosome segregation ATPase
MEITIKTYDEISTERVKIEVVPGQRAEITIDGALSTATGAPSIVEVANVLGPADRAGRVLVLECRVAELETALRLKKNRIAELEADLKAAESRAAGWDLDRHTEKDRADQNREWAKRAEAKLAETLTALEESRALVAQRDAALNQAADDLRESREFRAKERQEARQKISRLAGKLSEIGGRVHRPGVDDDLVFDADSEHYDNLVRVIRDIRQALRRTSDLSDTGA